VSSVRVAIFRDRKDDLHGAACHTSVLLADDPVIVRAADAGPQARRYGQRAMRLVTSVRAVAGRFADPGAWPLRARDWLVIGAWLLFCAVDIALENQDGLSFTHPDPTPVQTWPFLVAFVGTLALRRRSPLVALVAGYALIVAAAVSGGDLEKGFLPIFLLAYLQFCAARAARDGRDTRIAMGVALAGILVATFCFDGDATATDWIWAGVMIDILPTAAARAFRNHEHLAQLLEERRDQLEVERDERARLAIAQERERIAGELHDVVAHGVSAMVVQAAAARRIVAAHGDTEAGSAAIAEVERSGRAALDELRRLLGVLRRGDEPIALAPQPSLARVDRLVARLHDEGLPIELAVEGTPAPLPAGLDVTAYRIVEEALAAVLRQEAAGATRVAVRYRPRELELEVADDAGPRTGAGAGDPDREAGTMGLRERVALFGGELHAGRRRGGGWTVQARLPIEREALT